VRPQTYTDTSSPYKREFRRDNREALRNSRMDMMGVHNSEKSEKDMYNHPEVTD
jgi:hypothetical protein